MKKWSGFEIKHNEFKDIGNILIVPTLFIIHYLCINNYILYFEKKMDI